MEKLSSDDAATHTAEALTQAILNPIIETSFAKFRQSHLEVLTTLAHIFNSSTHQQGHQKVYVRQNIEQTLTQQRQKSEKLVSARTMPEDAPPTKVLVIQWGKWTCNHL